MTPASPGRPPGLLGQALARRAVGVVVVALAVGVPLTLLSSRQPGRTYSAVQVFLLPSADEDSPLLVSENADRSARDYASVLRSDELLMSQVGEAVGESAGHVRRRLEVGYLPRTGSIAVRYTASDRYEVSRVLGALERALGSGLESSRVRAVGAAEVSSARNPVNPFPGAGLLGGLVVAVVAALLVERSRSRVLGRSHLRELTDRPVLEVGSDGSDDQVELLAVRLLRPGARSLALHAAPGVPEEAVDALRDRLVAALPGLVAERRVPTADVDVRSGGDGPWALVTSDATTTRELTAALAALDADAPGVVVLLVREAVPA